MGEGAEAEQVDLEESEILDVFLIPLDDRPAFHRRVLDWHQVVHRFVSQQEAARMNGEVAGEVLDFVHQA